VINHLHRVDSARTYQVSWPVGIPIVGRYAGSPDLSLFFELAEGIVPFVPVGVGVGPGMKLLQFAWGDNMPTAVDAPHNYPINCVVYTGTHDNNTTKGWFKTEMKPADKKRLSAYSGINVTKGNIDTVLPRIAYASVAETAILPIQDLLGLDEKSRINTPGSSKNNWLWRLPKNALSEKLEQKLLQWISMYNRQQLF
ncbi:MAG: 4-alpha-glucanotransferase, partial [Flavipsychrobacter sp.]